MSVILYYHGGSSNHGCEAIVRSTAFLFSKPLTVFSMRMKDDYAYGLDTVATIKSDSKKSPSGARRYLSAVYSKILNSDRLFIRYEHDSFFSQINKGDICLSVGGDNYCYDGLADLEAYNYWIRHRGGKTVLWGCSINPDNMSTTVKRDLSKYDLIVAREHISFNCLKAINQNTVLFPDPAFCLAPKPCLLPSGFTPGRMIGINISPLIMKSESTPGITIKNYSELIRYILETTDFGIALIPHVVEPGNDDRETLKTLFQQFPPTNRIVMIDDHSAPELKYCISQCYAFIGARTHAVIASYSSFLPTLAVGYSTKAHGIAGELFGTDEGYVTSVQSLLNPTDLVEAFARLMNHEQEIRKQLNEVIPNYSYRCSLAAKLVEELVQK